MKYILICCMLVCWSCRTTKTLPAAIKEIEVSENERHYLLLDSDQEKYYLINLIRKLQSEKKLGETPMLIVDGDPKFHYYKTDIKPANITKDKIRKIKIVEADKCVQLFGAACKYGLITVTTYGAQEKIP